jgi:hypothetical protein
MKLWEFERLCKTEWDNGQGDVRTLWLLEPSLRELQSDITQYTLKGGGKFLPVHTEDVQKVRDGGHPMYAVNPSTRMNPERRGEVHLRICRDQDMADVFFPDGSFEAHVLSRS